MLVDPAVNLVFERMKRQLSDYKEKLEQAQSDLSAWKFTPDRLADPDGLININKQQTNKQMRHDNRQTSSCCVCTIHCALCTYVIPVCLFILLGNLGYCQSASYQSFKVKLVAFPSSSLGMG